jgi:hypothetical protein
MEAASTGARTGEGSARDQAVRDPSATFATPAAVVQREDLSRTRKIEILRRWEQDARALEVADEENMGGERTVTVSVLQEVREALRALGAGQGPRRAAPTKHGGG